jgi:hypothetical protein
MLKISVGRGGSFFERRAPGEGQGAPRRVRPVLAKLQQLQHVSRQSTPCPPDWVGRACVNGLQQCGRVEIDYVRLSAHCANPGGTTKRIGDESHVSSGTRPPGLRGPACPATSCKAFTLP